MEEKEIELGEIGNSALQKRVVYLEELNEQAFETILYQSRLIREYESELAIRE